MKYDSEILAAWAGWRLAAPGGERAFDAAQPLIHPASLQGTGRAVRRPYCLSEWADAKLRAAHQKSKMDDFVF